MKLFFALLFILPIIAKESMAQVPLDDGPYKEATNNQNVIKIQTQPERPRKPQDGRDGSYDGSDGEDTIKPENAKTTGDINVYITKNVEGPPGNNQKIYFNFKIETINPEVGQPQIVNYKFSQDGKEKIFLNAEGIAGADGARAGDGADGYRGSDGADATQHSWGKDGSPGGPGGDGGESTDGGRGGNAGKVKIFVAHDALSALNIFNDDAPGILSGLIPGGIGGAAGQHGRGGDGGQGGSGGSGYTWYTTETETYTDLDGNTHTRDKTDMHYNPGGSNGSSGVSGRTPSKPLSTGEKGTDNSFEIHVANANGKTDIYTRGAFQFQVEIIGLTSADYKSGGVPDNILEPRESIELRLKVKNLGNMPSPKDAKLLIQIDFENSKDVGKSSNAITEISFNDEIAAGAEVILSEPIIIPIDPSVLYPFRNDKRPRVRVAVKTLQFRESPNRFVMSSEYGPAVMIHKVIGSPTLLPGESTEIAFIIQNLSNITWGSDTESKRKLEIHIQHMLQSRDPDIDLDLGDLIYSDEFGNNEMSLAKAFANSILSLKGQEQIVLKGRVKLREETKAYMQGDVVVSLSLGSLENFSLPERIWERDFRVQAAQPFQLSTDPRNPTKLVVFTNNRTSMAEILFFKQFARDLGIHMADYNLSLYGGPNWDDFKGIKDALFVVLNNQYDPVYSNHMPAELFAFNTSLASVSKLDESNRFLFMGPTDYGVEFEKRILPIFEIAQQNQFNSPDDFLKNLRSGNAATSVFGYGNMDTANVANDKFFGGKPTKDDIKNQAKEVAEKLSELFPEQRFMITHAFNPQESGGFFKKLFVQSNIGNLGIYRGPDRNRQYFGFLSTGNVNTATFTSGTKDVYYSLFRMMSITDLFYHFQIGGDHLFKLDSNFGRAFLDALVSHFANELLYVTSTSTDRDRLFPSFLALERFSTNQSFSDTKVTFMNHLLATLEFMIKPDASFLNNAVNSIAGLFITSDKRQNLSDLLDDIKSKRIAGQDQDVEDLLLSMRNAYSDAKDKPDQNELFRSYLNFGGYESFKGTKDLFGGNLVLEESEWKKLVETNTTFNQNADQLKQQEVAIRKKNLGEPLTPAEKNLCDLYLTNIFAR
jgi:hypothetical protein